MPFFAVFVRTYYNWTISMLLIFEYKSYRVFLKEFISYSQKQNPKYSLRLFAKKIGINPSSVVRILNGQRNISSDLENRIISTLKLRTRKARYFSLLVKYDQAKRPAEKRIYYEQLRLFRYTKLKTLPPTSDEYFLHWYNVATRELLNIVQGNADSNKLSKLLIPHVKPNDIRKSLTILRKLGLIVKNKKKKWVPTDKFVSTPNEWTNTATHSFQCQMADLGRTALDAFPKSDRDISTLTISLSENGLNNVKEIITQARQDILQATASDTNVTRVYQVNLQLFPLSGFCKENA